MMYYVYVLESLKDNHFYIGCTNNIKNRLQLHNLGKVYSTKLRRPFKIIYCEIYPNKGDAFTREKFLKT